MRTWILIAAIVAASAILPRGTLGQELLTNGGLELVPPDFGGLDASPPGWKVAEGPLVPSFTGPYLADYNNGGVTLPCPPTGGCGAVDAADYVVWRKHQGETFALPNEGPGISPGIVNEADYLYWRRNFGAPRLLDMGQPSNFAHLIFEGDWQFWFEPFNGTQAGYEDNSIHLTQTVPGTPGVQYTMEGWALFEDYFAGGVTNLNAQSGGTPTGAPFDDGPVSPTDTYFGLDFLDAGGAVISMVEKELKADGQPSNTTWFKHTLTGVAPAGTASVRVRATMLDGVYNPLPSPQVFQESFFVDAFSLVAAPGSGALAGSVPEPASLMLAAMAVAALGSLRYRWN